jgi:uncharacterized repeat protein (TIGR01451 family)
VGDADFSTILVVMPVYGPAIRISQDPARTMVNPNDADASHRQAKFYIAVINPGNVALTNIQVTNGQVPDCNRSFATLAPGAVQYYTCYKSVTSSFVSTVTASGSPVGGGPAVNDTDVDPIVVANYVLEAGYSVNRTTVQRNQELTFTISLENITVGVTAPNVAMYATLPPGTTFKRVINGSYSNNLAPFNKPGVYWQGPVPGATAPGQYTFRNMTMVVQVNAVGGDVSSVGLVTTSGEAILNDTQTAHIIPAHAEFLPAVRR